VARLFQQTLILSAVLVLVAGSADAQSRLNFPRILSPRELSTTGFALVNTSSSAVSATFNVSGGNGQLVTSRSISVPPGGQIARTGSEVLGAASEEGWVQITSSSAELQGFELVGDFSTNADGAGPAAEGKQLGLVDFSREDVIYIINTSGQTGTVSVVLNDPSGSVLGTRSISLKPLQPASVRVADLNADDNIDLITLSADFTISASIMTKLPAGLDIAMTNAIPTVGAASDLYFPFVTNGRQGASNWTTLLGVANLASSSQNISLTFNPDIGTATTVQRTLAPGASVGDSIARLFSLPADAFTSGWIRVTGSASLVAVAAYQDSANGALATVPSQSSGNTRFFFGHIASISPWYTGIALLNTTTTTANVEVSAIDGSGQLVGSNSTFSLPAGSRRTVLISELVPQLLKRSADGGFVFVRTTNSVPILGFELFGHAVAPILANVQGFNLSSSSSFTPPATGGSGTPQFTITSVTTTDGTAAKTLFKALDLIAYIATINNASGSSAAAELAYDIKDSRGQSMLTTTLSFTMAVGTDSLVFVGFVPSNALNGAYTVTASLQAKGVTATKSATYTVSGGTDTPTISQETLARLSPRGVSQVAFRPGDTARFAITTSNFLTQSAAATLTYSLLGPNNVIGASGSLSFSAPTGLSSRTVDVTIPASATYGLYVFKSTVTAGGSSLVKTTAITVAIKNSGETAEVDGVYVTDTDGIPRGGFAPGSSITLNTSRLTLSAVPLPATLRYSLRGPNGSVLDQPLGLNLVNGRSQGAIPLTLGSNAGGVHTFTATLTYQDYQDTTRTSTLDTQFTVAPNPPTLTPAVTARRPYVEDINLIGRTVFSQGETFLVVRTVYSSFPTPVSGTVRYQVQGTGANIDTTINVTFNPGENSGLIPLTSSVNIPPASYTVTITATAQGATNSNTAQFSFVPGVAPSLAIEPEAKTSARSSSTELFRIDSAGEIALPSQISREP
jgi:hypothetical protein